MKRFAFVFILLLACLMFSAASAAEVAIPATSEDALALAPAAIPPALGMTVKDEMNAKIYFLTGLDQWPLKHASRYQKGLFQMELTAVDGLHAVKGQEEEPFSVRISNDNESYLTLLPSSGKYKSLTIDFQPEWRDVRYHINFSDGTSYLLDSRGDVVRYLFASGKNRFDVQYDAQGLLTSAECINDRFQASYDALGELKKLTFMDKSSNHFIFDGKRWMDDQYEACKAPAGFDMKTVPTLKLSPAEKAEQARARAAEAMSCIPDAVQKTGPDMLSLFAPLPAVTVETDEMGSVSVTVTGLEAWGIESQLRQEQWEAGSWHPLRKPEYPLGTSVHFISAEVAESWRNNAHVYIASRYKGVEVFLSYRERKEKWEFTYCSAEGNEYCFALGDEPYLSSWYWKADDRTTVGFTYNPNGETVGISVDREMDKGTACAFYSKSGELVDILLAEEEEYEYNARENQWRMFTDDGELIPCEAPEGFDLSLWMELPPQMAAVQTP